MPTGRSYTSHEDNHSDSIIASGEEEDEDGQNDEDKGEEVEAQAEVEVGEEEQEEQADGELPDVGEVMPCREATAAGACSLAAAGSSSQAIM